jgi:hypothetical protein
VPNQRPRSSFLRPLTLCLLLGLLPGLLLAPLLVRGYAALQWTCYLSDRNADAPRPGDARSAGRWAAAVVDDLAPLPAARLAARLALDLGRRLQIKDAAASRALVVQVRQALERAEASPFRGYGLRALREEAWQIENSRQLDPDPSQTP